MHTQQAERTELAEQLSRLFHSAGLEPVGDMGLDLLGEHRSHALAHRDLLGRQQVVERERVGGVERRLGHAPTVSNLGCHSGHASDS